MTGKTFCNIFTFHYVSISTMLLRLANGRIQQFTFHYVSISTCIIVCILNVRTIYIPLCIYFNSMLSYRQFTPFYLHSTMYLFQLQQGLAATVLRFIYIPLCIYFNGKSDRKHTAHIQFTFHYVSISTCNRPCNVYVISYIYIPLCIYFNLIININMILVSKFTFHYVSISTHSFCYRNVSCMCIYIPLCIYFNFCQNS